jgi:hypothetical protein
MTIVVDHNDVTTNSVPVYLTLKQTGKVRIGSMSRLRSLQSPAVRPGPAPSSTPSRSRQSTSNPYPQDTSTYHRKLRAILGEVDACMDAWDEAAKDAFAALQGIVNEGTEME